MASDAHLRTLRAIGFNARRADGTIPEEESAMKSDDTKPAVLSAARLAEIREREAAATKGPWRAGVVDKDRVFVPYDGALEGPNGERVILRMNAHFPFEADAAFVAHAREDVPALLAHLDALAAGEVPDGEALGRGLFEHMSVMAWPDGRGKIGGPGWDGLREDSRSYYRGAALALYTRGRTAGRAEGAGSETSAHLIEARNTAQRTAEEAHATIARLQAELAEARGAVIHADFAGGLSVCARPGETTKDVERITCPACLVKLYSVAADDADKMREQVDRLTAEIDAARIEGARVEREALDLYLLAAYQETGYEGPVASALSDALDWLRARGAGGAG